MESTGAAGLSASGPRGAEQRCSILFNFFLLVFLSLSFLHFNHSNMLELLNLGDLVPKYCGSCSDPNNLPKHSVVIDQ